MAMFGKIRRMYYRDGLSLSEIARRTSLSRNTIEKWVREPEGAEPRYRRREVPRKLVPFEAQLLQALETDARLPRRERRTALKLYVELGRFHWQLLAGARVCASLARSGWQGGGKDRLCAAEVRVGGSLPVRLERREDGDWRHLPPASSGPSQAMRQPGILAKRTRLPCWVMPDTPSSLSD